MTASEPDDAMVVTHLDDVDWIEALPQYQGDQRLAIHLKVLVSREDRLVSYTRYDPGLVVEPHWHDGDEVIYVLEGEMTIRGRRCPAGSAILLRRGTPTGPIVAGDDGAVILEVFFGTNAGAPVFVEDQSYRDLAAARAIRSAPPATT